MQPIAFSGKISSGKTTIAQALREKYHYIIFSIGDNIKNVSACLIEGKNEELQNMISFITKDSEKQNELLMYYQELFQLKYQDVSFEKGKNGQYIKTESYRSFTQEIAKNTRIRFGEDVWIKLVVNQMLSLHEEGKNVICDDIRMPLEKEIFEKAGFKIIRIDVDPSLQRKRAEKLYGKMDEERFLDETEVSLDHAQFDLRFDLTNKSVEEVVKIVEESLLFQNEASN